MHMLSSLMLVELSTQVMNNDCIKLNAQAMNNDCIKLKFMRNASNDI